MPIKVTKPQWREGWLAILLTHNTREQRQSRGARSRHDIEPARMKPTTTTRIIKANREDAAAA